MVAVDAGLAESRLDFFERNRFAAQLAAEAAEAPAWNGEPEHCPICFKPLAVIDGRCAVCERIIIKEEVQGYRCANESGNMHDGKIRKGSS